MGQDQFNPRNAPELQKLRQCFIELEFGMFIHFNMGTYHEIEWVDPGQDPAGFNPTKLDCGQWADAAKSAGMKYAVLTTKHHDGFCLWDSKFTGYSVAASPIAGRDIVREYCDAFRDRGIEPHFYFSIWDRQNGVDGKDVTPQNLEFIKGQLTELFTNYGDIPTLTFDGWGNCGPAIDPAHYEEVYAHVKSLQPNTMITDHYQVERVQRKHEISLDEAYAINDFLHFEEPRGDWAWAPVGNTFASHQGPTIQSQWFWKKSFPNEPLMSVTDIVDDRLAVLKERNCNLLLNAAPNPDGLMDDNVMQRLAEIGQARAT